MIYEPKKNGRRLSLKEKKAIISDASAGMQQIQIAAKYGIDRSTVARVLRQFRQECPTSELSLGVEGIRRSLVADALPAVQAGPRDPRDSYKRAGIGCRILEGVGVLDKQQAPAPGISVLFTSMPLSLAPHFKDCLEVTDDDGNTIPGEQLTDEEATRIIAEIQGRGAIPATAEEPAAIASGQPDKKKGT